MTVVNLKSGPAFSLRIFTILLAGLAMFGPFSIDTIFPAFPQMGSEFNASKIEMQQTISIYLIAYALMSLLHGPLSDHLGRRKIILMGLVVFISASIGCALSRNLPTLLLFRFIQGLSAGAGLIVGRAAIRDVLNNTEAQKLMSQVSMIFSIAPAIAPIMGGWILAWGRWPIIFWFLTGFSLLLLVACSFLFPETHPIAARRLFTSKQLVINYFYIFKNWRFQRLAAAASFNFAALFIYISSAPEMVIHHLKLTEKDFGWLFIPFISGMMLGAYISGKTAGKVAPQKLARMGFVVSCCGVMFNLIYTIFASHLSIPWAVLPLIFIAMGLSMVSPVLTLAILDMYPEQRGAAASLQAFTQLVVSASVAGILSPLISHNPLYLAISSALFAVVAWLLWFWEYKKTH